MISTYKPRFCVAKEYSFNLMQLATAAELVKNGSELELVHSGV